MIAHLGPRAIVVDLNNFARYPTVAVGYLAALLRGNGCDVRVLSPLALGVPGLTREPRASFLNHLDQQIRMATALSGAGIVARARRRAVGLRRRARGFRRHRVVEQLRAELTRGADVVLVSAYLMYFDLCCELGELCREFGVPLIIGGSYFFQPKVAREWLSIPGLTALACGEAEPAVCEVVRSAIAGDDLSRFPGIRLPDGRSGPEAAPFSNLDAGPFPDYSDFPWERYPNAIVPMITGRGCRWGACTFCSDVTSTAGRTFRSRTPEYVLDEAQHQAGKHAAKLFVFTDLKLNSSLSMWRTIIDRFQGRVPGAQWVAAVHVGARGENGLSKQELAAARAAGMVRVTTGLESGSQRVLDAMKKGTDLEVTSRFLHEATEAGISVRTTMILGYPGETPEDVLQSARFLQRHAHVIDRVSLNRLAVITGTPLERTLAAANAGDDSFIPLTINHRMATVEHRRRSASHLAYRAAAARLVAAVHAINRKSLRDGARDFEGVM